MELWKAYAFATFLADYIRSTGDCLYNAMVRRLAVLTKDELLAIRGSLYDWIKMIDDELGNFCATCDDRHDKYEDCPNDPRARTWQAIEAGDVRAVVEELEKGRG